MVLTSEGDAFPLDAGRHPEFRITLPCHSTHIRRTGDETGMSLRNESIGVSVSSIDEGEMAFGVVELHAGHAARSCITHRDRARDRLGPWRDGCKSSMHKTKVTVSLADKIARIEILTKTGAPYQERVSVFS